MSNDITLFTYDIRMIIIFMVMMMIMMMTCVIMMIFTYSANRISGICWRIILLLPRKGQAARHHHTAAAKLPTFPVEGWTLTFQETESLLINGSCLDDLPIKTSVFLYIYVSSPRGKQCDFRRSSKSMGVRENL